MRRDRQIDSTGGFFVVSAAACEIENARLSGVSNSSECPRDTSLIGVLTPIGEITMESSEGRKMDKSTNSFTQCNNVFSGTSTTPKRGNPYLEDNPVVAKKRRTEQSVHTSTTNSKPSRTVTSLELMNAEFSRLNFKFQMSSAIKERVAVGNKIDIIGFVVKLQPPMQIQTRSGTSKWMRKVILADDKGCEIELAIWGGDVNNRDIPLNSVITARGVIVQDYHGDKILNCLWAQMEINPQVPQPAPVRKPVATIEKTRDDTPKFVVAKLIRDADESSRCSKSSFDSNFMSIGEIKTTTVGSHHVVAGLVVKIKEPEEQITKAGDRTWFRVVTVADAKDSEIAITIWGDEVKVHDIPMHSVITVNAKVQRFYGRTTLSCSWPRLRINPDIEEATELRKLIVHYQANDEMPNSVVAKLPEDADESSRCSKSSYLGNFMSVEEIKTTTVGSQRDVAGLVVKINQPEEQVTKAGDRTWFRVVTVADAKDSEIAITIWGDEVKVHDIPIHSVITVNAKVRRFYGRTTLSCSWPRLRINPDIEEATELRKLIAHYQAKDEMPNSVVAKLPVVADESSRCSKSSFVRNFMSIEEFKTATVGSEHDIAGLVVKINDPEDQITKAGDRTWFRVVTVADAKDSEITITIWGNEVKVHDIPIHSVITANAKVRRFYGRTSLSCSWPRLQINPDIPESSALIELIAHYPAASGTAKLVVAGSSENEVCHIDEGDLPWFNNFSTVSKIKQKATAGSKHDVEGRVINHRSYGLQDRKNGKRSSYSNLIITDDKGCEIEIMIWREESQQIYFPLHSVITAESFTVRGFNEKKILRGALKNATIHLNIPQLERREKLIVDHSVLNKLNDMPIAEPSKTLTDASYSRGINRYRTNVFTPIEEIKNDWTNGATYNIIGIVVARMPTEKRKSADGKDLIVRDLIVADEQESEINLSIWGSGLLENDIPLYSVIIAKNVTLQEDDSVENLSCVWSDLEINPNILRAALLKQRMAVDKLDENKRALPSEFDPISMINANLEVNTKWDVIGFVGEARAPKLVQWETGENLWLTAVKLRDDVGNWIDLLVWCDTFPECRIPLKSVLAVPDATVENFEGKLQLCTLWNWVAIDPDIPAARSDNESETTFMISSGSGSACHDDNISNLVPIKAIKRLNTPTNHINTFGLVVGINPPEEDETLLGNKFVVRKCILRGRYCAEIELHIKCDMPIPFDIPIQSVIVASRASLKLNDEKNLVLVCSCVDVRFNVNIPETKGFKYAVLNTPDVPAAQKSNNFTPIATIKKKTNPGIATNIVGLVVDVLQPRRRKLGIRKRFQNYIARVTLRDADNQMMELIIRWNDKSDNAIKVNSVLGVRDAIVKLFGDDKILWCRRINVTIEPAVPERNKLRTLMNIPFVKRFTSLTELKQNSWLQGCPVDIIGQVVEMNLITDRTVYPYTEIVLKNEIEMTLRVYGVDRFWTRAMLKNAIIVAKNALLTKAKKRKPFLLAYPQDVNINPIIPNDRREAMSFGIVSIQRILETAKAGDMMGILAVIVDSPNIVNKSGWRMHDDIGSSCAEHGEEDTELKVRELDGKYVNLIDSSGKTILMKIWPTLTSAVKKRIDKPVILRAINAEVRVCGGELRLACTKKGSCVVNPETKEAEELLEWYTSFCKSKERSEKEQEFRVIPIRRVLEDVADDTVASIMGILIKSKIQKIKRLDVRLLIRHIQVIGGGKKIIHLLMHDSAAINFAAPLHSVIMVKNFRVSRLTKCDIKIGICDRQTEFIVNPADDKYRQVTERLVSWFLLNSANINAERFPAIESNPVIRAAGGTTDINDIEMVECSEKMEEDTQSLREESASAGNERNLVEPNSARDESSPDIFSDC